MSKKIHVIFNVLPGGSRIRIGTKILGNLQRDSGVDIIDAADTFVGASGGAGVVAALNVPANDNSNSPLWNINDILENQNEFLPILFKAGKIGRCAKFFSAAVNDVLLGEMLNVPNFSTFRKFFSAASKYDDNILDRNIRSQDNGFLLRDSLKSIVISAKEIPYRDERTLFSHFKYAKEKSNLDHLRIADCVSASCRLRSAFNAKTIEIDGVSRHFIDEENSSHEYHFYKDIKDTLPEDTEIYVVSIGNGYALPEYTVEDYNSSSRFKRLYYSSWEDRRDYCFGEDTKLRSEIGDRYIKLDGNLTPYINKYGMKHVGRPDVATALNMKHQDQAAEFIYEANKEKVGRVISLMQRNMS